MNTQRKAQELTERRERLIRQYHEWMSEGESLCVDATKTFIEKYGTNEILFNHEKENAPISTYNDKYDSLKECQIKSIRYEEGFKFNIVIYNTGEEIEDAETTDFQMNFARDWNDLTGYIIEQIKNGRYIPEEED